ncbi:MAG: glycosyltransferase [Sphingomonas sp.]|nr:glycosyltransferase [Sphingomonas sp.]
MIAQTPVYCDITELVSNPIRTGIQRVAREVIRNWDGDRPLRLCRFDRARKGLVELPSEVNYYLLEPDDVTRSASASELQSRLSDVIASREGNEVGLDATIFIPEVFFNELRCLHYLWRIEHSPQKVHALFHDFIPWLQPDVIGVQRSNQLMWYLRFAQRIRKAAFNSEATRRDWLTRIVRDEHRNGTILALGADGLGLPRQYFAKEKRAFVALGSIDGRKNQLAILRAFKMLWADNLAVGLTLVGRVFDAEAALRAELEESSDYTHFRHVGKATDAELGQIMSNARATIYASATEGYGLPPVESLYAGIPCIVSKHVPSVAHLADGLRFLDEVTPEEIAKQVRALANDVEAEKAWAEAANHNLPTWKQFGSAVSQWIGES